MADDLEVKEGEKESSGLWYSILDTALKIPGAKIDRDDFLEKLFGDKYREEEALARFLDLGPVKAGMSVEALDKIADSTISDHTATVTGTSFLTGLPGGIAMAGTIPLDIAQYYWHVIVIAQKLAYIYGMPDLRGEDNEDFLSMLTILIGVMSGAHEADDSLQALRVILSKEAVSKTMPKVVLAKVGGPIVARNVAGLLGAHLAHQGLSRGISRIVPIVGGAIAGLVSFTTYKPMADTLKLALRADIADKDEVVEGKDKDGSGVWYKILNTALKIPGAKIDRDDFLDKTFRDTHKDDALAKLLDVGPGKAGVPTDALDKIADKIINDHTAIVTGTSFAAGLPGGIAMAGTIPADLAQYYWHVIVIAQKLAYVYGWPDLRGENSNSDDNDDYLAVLTLLIGVMSGAQEATDALKDLCKSLSKAAVTKKLPNVMLAKVGGPIIARNVATRLGAHLAKQGISRGISRIVPIIGGIVAGAVSFATFKPMSVKLKDALHADVIRSE